MTVRTADPAAVWITQEHVTLEKLKGVVQALELKRVPDGARVHLLPVSPDRGVLVPQGDWKKMDGTSIQGGGILTVDNLPDTGILFVAD
jgi:hypothetical protein